MGGLIVAFVMSFTAITVVLLGILAAYAAVSRRKGYRFVGMNAFGFNAIFLRDDVLATEMPEIPLSVLDANPFAEQMRALWWPRLAQLPWIKVPADGNL